MHGKKQDTDPESGFWMIWNGAEYYPLQSPEIEKRLVPRIFEFCELKKNKTICFLKIFQVFNSNRNIEFHSSPNNSQERIGCSL